MKDYYLILQIDRNAEPEVISFAYKALAKKNHPDAGGTPEKMKLLNEAYDILKDPDSKSEYDKIYDQEKADKARSEEEKKTVSQERAETREHAANEAHNYNESQSSSIDLAAKVLEENLSDNVYEVLVRKLNVIIPWSCTCCLEKPDNEVNIRYKFSDKEVLQYNCRFINMAFPICRSCKKHMLEFLIKRLLFIALSMLPSIILVLLLAYAIPRISLAVLMIVGLITAAGSIFLSNKLIKMSEIDDIHANRGSSVSIVDCGQWGIKFWFSNWLYAEEFAKENNGQVISLDGNRYGRESSFLNRRTAFHTVSCILLVIAGFTVIVSIFINFNFFH
jgi:hypothetical protein